MRNRQTPLRLYLWALVGAASVSVAACGSSGSAPTTTGSPTTGSPTSAVPSTEAAPDLSGVTLTVAVSTTRGKGRQAVRLASGAYDGTPYTIKWAEFANGDAALQAVNAGAADVMGDLQTTNAVVAAGNAKEPWTEESRLFSIVGAVLLTSKQGAQLVVKSDSGINSIADLKGKKVAYSKGSSSEFFWSLLAKEAGLAKGDVEEVKLKLSEAKAAFLAGDVDAIVSFEYNLFEMVRTENLKVLANSADRGVPLYSLIVVRRGLLDDPARRSAVADLIERIHAAESWSGTNLAAARKIWEELDGVDPLDSEQFVLSSIAKPAAIDEALIAAVQQQIDVFFARGLIEHSVDAHVLFDTRLGS